MQISEFRNHLNIINHRRVMNMSLKWEPNLETPSNYHTAKGKTNSYVIKKRSCEEEWEVYINGKLKEEFSSRFLARVLGCCEDCEKEIKS